MLARYTARRRARYLRLVPARTREGVFPGTKDPLPPLLTPVEAVRVLRLDVVTSQEGEERARTLPDALMSLNHLVRIGHLLPKTIGKSRVFARDDVLRLVVEGAPMNFGKFELDNNLPPL